MHRDRDRDQNELRPTCGMAAMRGHGAPGGVEGPDAGCVKVRTPAGCGESLGNGVMGVGGLSRHEVAAATRNLGHRSELRREEPLARRRQCPNGLAAQNQVI